MAMVKTKFGKVDSRDLVTQILAHGLGMAIGYIGGVSKYGVSPRSDATTIITETITNSLPRLKEYLEISDDDITLVYKQLRKAMGSDKSFETDEPPKNTSDVIKKYFIRNLIRLVPDNKNEKG